MDKEYYHTLLQRYFDNQCSDDELLNLFKWINNEEFISKFKLDPAIEKDMEDENTDDLELNLDNILSRIKEKTHPSSRVDGHKEVSRATWFAKARIYAAILIVAVLLSDFGWFAYTTFNKHSQPIVFATEKGMKAHVSLSDGSYVTLNSESKLSFLSTQTRDVYLQGEAFLRVTKDKKRQFEVHTKYLSVIVYGTSFNVKTNVKSFESDSIVKVTLLEGSVGLKVIGEDRITYITPGQEACFNVANQSLKVFNIDIDNAALWRNDKLVLTNVDLQTFVSKIESWYGINITLIKLPKKQPLYTMKIRDESIEDVLSIINKLTAITYTIKGKEVSIAYK